MDIIWLGHGSFRIEIEDQVLLIDPWLTDNPRMEGQDHQAAIAGATQILVTHGHFDHTNDIAMVSKTTGAPVSGMFELAKHLFDLGAKAGHAFNKGGTLQFGDVKVTMVPASHSSSIDMGGRDVYMGAETGFVIRGEGHCIYFSGDTAIMADMEWIGDFFKPDIGILSAGGVYTMDMEQAAYAARKYFDFKAVIPCHYKTAPGLEMTAETLIARLPDVNVIEPEVLEPISFLTQSAP